MRPSYDYLIVGAGFAGSVAAERLARVFDKRVLNGTIGAASLRRHGSGRGPIAGAARPHA